jgi:hypothetical protein
LNIVQDKNNDTVMRTDYLESISSGVDVNDSAVQDKLALICLADVDLASGKKYVLYLFRFCLM